MSAMELRKPLSYMEATYVGTSVRVYWLATAKRARNMHQKATRKNIL
jgi:hypothetical protein